MKAYPQIDALLDQTENAQRCAHSSDPLIQKGLYRRYAREIWRAHTQAIRPCRILESAERARTIVARGPNPQQLHPNWVFAGITAAAAHGFDHPRFLHRQGLTITLPNHGSYRRTTNSISSTAHIPEKMRYSQTESMSLIPLVPYWTVDGR